MGQFNKCINFFIFQGWYLGGITIAAVGINQKMHLVSKTHCLSSWSRWWIPPVCMGRHFQRWAPHRLRKRPRNIAGTDGNVARSLDLLYIINGSFQQ